MRLGRGTQSAAVPLLLFLGLLTPRVTEARLFGGFRPLFGTRFVSQPSFPSTTFRSCGQFSCVSSQPVVVSSGPSSYGGGTTYGSGRNFVNNRFDPNDFDNIASFSALATQNGNLFEKQGGFVVAQLFIDPHTGELLSVGIDRHGRVRGYPRLVLPGTQVFDQTTLFYFQNFEAFNKAVRDAIREGDRNKIRQAERNRDLVASFLDYSRGVQGLRRNGGVTIDTSTMEIPDSLKDKGLGPAQIGVAAFNQLIGMLNRTCGNPCVQNPPLPGNFGGGCTNVGNVDASGRILANLSGFFGQRTIDFAFNRIENPYSCPGSPNRNDIPLPFLVAKLLGDPNTYYQLTQFVDFEDEALQRGVSANSIKAPQSRELKIPVAPGESIVANGARVLGVQRQDGVKGRFGGQANYYISYDYANNVAAGVNRVTGLSINPLADPGGAIGAQNGGEIIAETCSGSHDYRVINNNGLKVGVVPAEIARHSEGGNAISGDGVATPLSCIQCHIDGSRVRPGEIHKTNVFAGLNPQGAQFARAVGFATPEEYRGVSKTDSDEFVQWQRLTNQRIEIDSKDKQGNPIRKGMSATYEVVKQYYKDLDDADVARELRSAGLTVAALKAMGVPVIETRNSDNTVKYTIKRDIFAANFCRIKAAVTAAVGGPPGRPPGDTGNGGLGPPSGTAGASHRPGATGRPTL